MEIGTICFCLKDDQVLLALKKRGFGVGKWNGYGGKLKTSETPIAAATRELEEESGLLAEGQDLEQVAFIRFYFAGKLKWGCHVFLLRHWQGEPIETEEMKPCWYPLDQLPFKAMWVSDSQWIPLALSGNKFEAVVYFNADGSAFEKFEYKALS